MDLFFLHNIPIRILRAPHPVDLSFPYERIFHYYPGALATMRPTGHLLIYIHDNLSELLDEIIQLVRRQLTGITILPTDGFDPIPTLQQYFKFVKASGGIVRKESQLLMIYRAHRWDLPKGGIEQGETALQAAVREVYEECGVKAHPRHLFYTTWYAFQNNAVYTIKETRWYIMDCIEDAQMAPQKEEGIERVAWIPQANMAAMLNNTYQSIRLLLKAYHNRNRTGDGIGMAKKLEDVFELTL